MIERDRGTNYFVDYEDYGFGPSAMEQNEALANMIQPPAPAKTDYTQALKQQILAQGRSDKWTGEGYGSAEKNANAMAEMLAAAGITDIRQFGKVDKYEPVEVIGYTLNGKGIQRPNDNTYYEMVYEGESENGPEYRRRDLTPQEVAQVKPNYGHVVSWGDAENPAEIIPIDASKVVERDGKLVGVTGQTFGNKETGQEINSGSGRWAWQGGDNLFGGTGAGKGNTGFRVNFADDGTPIFYTTHGSSNDLVNLFKDNPLLGAIAQVGAAYFGGPAGSAALSAAMGKDPVDILKSTALSYLGNAAGSAVSGMEGITDVLGKTGTEIASNAAKQFVGSGGNIDPVQALLSSGLNAGINTVATDLGMGDLTPAQQKMVSSGISGLIAGQTPEQIAMNIAMAAATAKPDSTLKSSLGPGDEQDFIDNLIPGYFQPGGAGYTEPAALPSPDEDFVPTMPAPEEMTVQPEPANIEEFIKSLEPYIVPAPSPAPEPILEPAPVPEEIPELVMTGERPTPSPDEDFMPTYPEEKIPELVMTGDRDKTQEHVFDPTFGGALPPDNLPYLPTDDDFVPTNEIEVPETPTTPVTTPKVPTPTKAPTTRAPTTPAASSGMDMMGLLALLGGQQQPVQQAPMQDPYAHIKLMEDLFGSTIDLTPAGENTAQRK